MVDGSTDKNNNEIVSIVCRYIVEGTQADDIKVVEHVVHMEHLPDRSANGLFALVKRALNDLEISMNDGLVCQCYDAASVMSGERGGLQTLISNCCNRCSYTLFLSQTCIGFKGCLRRRRTGGTVFLDSKCLYEFALGLKVVLEDVEQVKQYFSYSKCLIQVI